MQQDVTLAQVLNLADHLSPVDKVRLIEHIAPQIEQELALKPALPLRSLYGLWKGFSVSEEDITEARKEMWRGFGERDI